MQSRKAVSLNRLATPAALLLACLISSFSLVAHADIYSFVDEQGVVHLSDFKVDDRYRVVLRETPPSVGMTPTIRLAGNSAAYREMVDQAAKQFALAPALLHAVITTESGYDPGALSRKGALGLMQLMPETARRYGVRDRRDPVENIRGGARYLSDLLKLFDNDLRLAVAAYNAGEEAVARYGRSVPPYPETQNYVKRVIALYSRYQQAM